MTIDAIMEIPLHFKVKGTMRNLYPTTMPLWSLLKGIQDNKALAETTEQGRKLLDDPEAFKAWKPRNLMSIYFAVRFRDPEGPAKETNVCGYTGLAGFDFDDVEAGPVLKNLRDIPQVICAGTSVSGKGVWCAARVAAATEREYVGCFADGIETFKAAGLPGIDAGIFDPTRARFVSYCPECWWRWDAMGDIPAFQPTGNLMVLSGKKRNAESRTALPSGYKPSPEMAYDEMRTILASAEDVADGDRNAEKARQCGKLKSLAAKAGVNPAIYAQPFIDKWDSLGSTHKKTVSLVNRLLLEKPKHE